ncbi:MAG: GatB/YqeY domain-containing protein [Pseudomonadota bacterium]|nr:GatB/YqeY domain-containing protein [SAR86 cluster bacterium]MEC8146807.1 GatB/YqeY domain-containing protein [Pseudomonadota bacterium]
MSDLLKPLIKEASVRSLKEGNKEITMVLRLILAEFQKEEISQGSDLNNNDELSLLQKMIKQRNDSIKQYNDAGRNELAEKEQKEIEIIQNFLPEQINEEDLIKLAKETISDLSANSMKDMGNVMKVLKDKTSGQADPATISKIVKGLLS